MEKQEKDLLSGRAQIGKSLSQTMPQYLKRIAQCLMETVNGLYAPEKIAGCM
jgi:hypothetical protein